MSTTINKSDHDRVKRERDNAVNELAGMQRKVDAAQEGERKALAQLGSAQQAANQYQRQINAMQRREREQTDDAAAVVTGAYEIRTKKDLKTRAGVIKKNTLMAFVTPVSPFDALGATDAVSRGNGVLAESKRHGEFMDRARGGEAIERLAQAEDEAKSIREEWLAQQRTLEAKDDEIAQLAAQLVQAQQQIEDLEAGKSDDQNEADENTPVQLADLNAKVEDLTARNAQLEAEHDKMKQELSSAKGLRTKAENKVEELQGQVAELEQQLEEATSPPEPADDAAPEDDDPERT